jgi:hypothetical protein
MIRRGFITAVLALIATTLIATESVAAGASSEDLSSVNRLAGPAARVKADVVAVQFVTAANLGDYRTVCRLYSAGYLKVSQASCRSLYLWGAQLYGRYDYRIVGRRTLANGHRRVDLIRWQHPSFIELGYARTGWRIVAGGW